MACVNVRERMCFQLIRRRTQSAGLLWAQTLSVM